MQANLQLVSKVAANVVQQPFFSVEQHVAWVDARARAAWTVQGKDAALHSVRDVRAQEVCRVPRASRW